MAYKTHQLSFKLRMNIIPFHGSLNSNLFSLRLQHVKI